MVSLKKTVSPEERNRRVQRPAVAEEEAVAEPNAADLQLRAAQARTRATTIE
jgi:hypothetical protein